MAELTVVGIDPASTKVAFVALCGGRFYVHTAAKLGKSGGVACRNAWHATHSFLTSIPWDWSDHALAAYVESPVVGRGGVRTTMVQCFTSGAIQAAMNERGFATETANVSSWKKRVVGKGNATKPEVAEHLRLRWPALYAASAGNQDLIDAACIAIFGQQLHGARMV